MSDIPTHTLKTTNNHQPILLLELCRTLTFSGATMVSWEMESEDLDASALVGFDMTSLSETPFPLPPSVVSFPLAVTQHQRATEAIHQPIDKPESHQLKGRGRSCIYPANISTLNQEINRREVSRTKARERQRRYRERLSHQRAEEIKTKARIASKIRRASLTGEALQIQRAKDRERARLRRENLTPVKREEARIKDLQRQRARRRPVQIDDGHQHCPQDVADEPGGFSLLLEGVGVDRNVGGNVKSHLSNELSQGGVGGTEEGGQQEAVLTAVELGLHSSDHPALPGERDEVGMCDWGGLNQVEGRVDFECRGLDGPT
ncbi:unnamed protein product [Choristocarpus tenellus]